MVCTFLSLIFWTVSVIYQNFNFKLGCTSSTHQDNSGTQNFIFLHPVVPKKVHSERWTRKIARTWTLTSLRGLHAFTTLLDSLCTFKFLHTLQKHAAHYYVYAYKNFKFKFKPSPVPGYSLTLRSNERYVAHMPPFLSQYLLWCIESILHRLNTTSHVPLPLHCHYRRCLPRHQILTGSISLAKKKKKFRRPINGFVSSLPTLEKPH